MKRPYLYLVAVLASASVSLASTSHALTPQEKAERLGFKQTAFAGLEFQRAALVGAGVAEPLLAFEVQDSSFINWRVPAARVAAFAEALALPEGFSLAKVQILEHEPARYYISLNIYQVTIAGTPGFRAEWSTYVVRDGDPKPRFMIIEAQSSVDSFDPVSGPTLATTVAYAAIGGQIQAQIVADGTEFAAQFDVSNCNLGNNPRASQAWAEANDLIYWGNGVADKAFYDSTLMGYRWVAIDPGSVSIDDDTRWAAFVEDEPVHVLYTDTALSFALSPMFNLNDPGLNLDAGHLAMLKGFKAQTYSGLGNLRGYLLTQGQGEALLDFTVTSEVPAYFINFEVPTYRVAALAEAIGLPEGLELARMRVLRDELPKYFISLNVYHAAGVATGMRAEWSVYVRTADAPGRTFFMVIDVASSVDSVDVVNLATPAAAVFDNTFEQDQITTSIVTATGTSFAATFTVPNECVRGERLNPKWIAANDRVYWTNGVYDKLYHNGTLIDADVVRVRASSVDIYDDTPWRAFVRPQPAHVLVFRNPQEFLLHPWYNLEEL